MADGGRGRGAGGGGHPDLGHLSDVVKQLASIQVDGDNLSRRLQDLRAVAAAGSSLCHGVAHTPPPRSSSMEEIDNSNSKAADASSTSNCSKAAVVRSPKRQHGSLIRDSIFNGDVLKLCSLTKLLTDENDRLQALNANLQAEIRETREAAKKNAADSEAKLRSAMRQLEEATRHMEILVRDKERLKQENAGLLVDHHHHQQQQQEEEPVTEEASPPAFGESRKSMHSVMAVLEREASALLQIDRAEGSVKSELQRLAMEFIQGVFKIEDEVTANKAAAASLRSNKEQEHVDVQQKEGEQQDTAVAAEWCRVSNALNYLLPTAAASGALIAIAISLKASSTAAALAVTEQTP